MKVLSETVRGMEEKEQKLTETGGRRKRDYLSLMANLLTATLFSTPIYTSNVTIYPETHTHTQRHTHAHTHHLSSCKVYQPGCRLGPHFMWVSDFKTMRNTK